MTNFNEIHEYTFNYVAIITTDDDRTIPYMYEDGIVRERSLHYVSSWLELEDWCDIQLKDLGRDDEPTEEVYRGNRVTRKLNPDFFEGNRSITIHPFNGTKTFSGGH